ncbi:MAG: hydrogenase maturation protease [Bacteroidota bacterium]
MPDEKILIIGLGNPILGDDGAGWRVVEGLKEALPPGRTALETDCLSLGGLSLMERLQGCERAILVDVMETGRLPPGTVSVFRLADLPDPRAGHSSSAHDTSLMTALETGRRMGLQLPESITVVAIEAATVSDFSEQLSPPVAAAIPAAIRAVLNLI